MAAREVPQTVREVGRNRLNSAGTLDGAPFFSIYGPPFFFFFGAALHKQESTRTPTVLGPVREWPKVLLSGADGVRR